MPDFPPPPAVVLPTYHFYDVRQEVVDTGNINASTGWVDVNLSAWLPFAPCLALLYCELHTIVLGTDFSDLDLMRPGGYSRDIINIEPAWDSFGRNTADVLQATDTSNIFRYRVTVGTGYTVRVRIYLLGYLTLQET